MIAYLKGHWQLLVLTALLFAAWHTPVVLPLKILIVFLHELSHAAATLLTGGEVVELSLSPQQGGHVISRGGARFAILTAGYLGSLVLGLALLLAALHTALDRAVLAGCGILTLAVAAFFIRDAFALAFCISTGAAMVAIAYYLPWAASDMILRVIGLSSVLYVPYDIFDDTILRADARSDARMLAEEFGGPTLLWGGLWLVLSLLVVLWCLKVGIGAKSNLSFDRTS